RITPPEWLLAFRRFARLPAALLLAALFAGSLRFALAQPIFGPADLAYYNGLPARLTGQIVGYPDMRDNAVQLTVQISEITVDGQAHNVRGKVLVRLPAGGVWQYGDTLRLSGELTTPSENEEFSYRDYLAVRGIHSTLYYPYAGVLEHRAGNPFLAGIYRLRAAANRTLQSIFPQPESALMSGILLGLERDIPADLKEAFQITGTSHIIAISGFNMAILAGLFFKASSRLLPRLWAPLVSILAIALYTVLVGAQASVVRAAVMSSMALIGRQIGRRGAAINSLAFAAAVMCVINPLLIYDVGFQLSCAATLGLILYADPLQAWVQTRLERRFSTVTARAATELLSEAVLLTTAAQITTLPLILYHFGRLSLSSIIANLFILPVQPLVMILGGLAMLAGLAWLPLGKLMGFIVWALPAYTNRMVRLLAGIPGGSVQSGAVPLALLVIFYVLLFSLTLGAGLRKYFPTVPDLAKRVRPPAVLASLALLCGVLWNSAALLPDRRLHVDVINMPDGPVVWVQMPAGET
ncbi:MAG: ComEC/Rec2 family competence protein, partial [Anaerolineaceae bacterium]